MACSQVSVEEKKGISRLEQVVEEISEAERAKEMKREQKRLKKKARRREKCKSNGGLCEWRTEGLGTKTKWN